MEKLIKEKQTVAREFRNFSTLYLINLKLTIKTVGSIITGVIFVVSVLAMFIVEYKSILIDESNSLYSNYKFVTYLVGSSTLIFHILLNCLFLFKKQIKDGISSIELRAGYKTWKSYLIRLLIVFTIASFYVTVIFLIALIIAFTNIESIAFFGNLHFSQVFYFYFLGFFVALVLSAMTIVFSTVIATALGMVFLFTIALGPLITSTKFTLFDSDTSVNYRTNLKMTAGSQFYSDLRSNKTIFNDDDGYGNSKTLAGINSYIESVLAPLEKYEPTDDSSSEEDKYQYMIVPSDFMSTFNTRNLLARNEYSNNRVSGYNYEKAINILVKNLMFGQVFYNYDVFESNNVVNQKYLLEGSPIWGLLEAINNAVSENGSIFSSSNPGALPSLFYQSNYSNFISVETADIKIDSFVQKLNGYLSDEHNEIINSINNFYNQYSTSIISENKDSANYGSFMNTIIDIGSYYTNSYTNSKWEQYTWRKFNENNYDGYGTDNFCQLTLNYSSTPINVCANQTLQSENDKQAEVYRRLPELTVLNALIIGLWKESMEFDVARGTSSIDDGLYAYHNSTVSSNTLKTSIFRHFAAMSAGLFSSAILNDSYNVNQEIFYQGQFLNITNIFDFENYSSSNKAANAAMTPVYANTAIKTNKAFLIPLAYFMYFILVLPLGYLGYFAFNRKAKV